MAISYSAAGSRNASGGATTRNCQVSAPAAGDLLIAVCVKKNNDAVTVTGTDYVKLGSDIIYSTTLSLTLAWKISAGVDPDACTFSWTNSVACAVHMSQWRGTSRYPFYSNVSNTNTGTGSTHSCTGITTAQANSFAVYFDVAAANTALATPAGWTEDADGGSPTSGTRDTWGHIAVATPGASGNISVTGANADWAMAIWEVIQAQSPPRFQKHTVYNWRSN